MDYELKKMSLRQAAKRLNISVYILKDLIDRDLIRSFRFKDKGRVYILEKDIKKFFDAVNGNE